MTAKYIGPKSKIARRFNEPIFGPDKVLSKKNYPSGMHGKSRHRSKMSEYAIQLREKQKAKFIYGVLEKQFSNIFKKSSHSLGITGIVLLQYLETRLDNIVYRLGITNTRSESRQLINHRHVLVNNKIVNIPSYQIIPGDEISIKIKSNSQINIIKKCLSKNTCNLKWLQWNNDIMTGKLINYPDKDSIPENIKEQLIVELYSK
ncbi:MAG: 30S ribosomal protein S4 [Bacteroides sp.]|nr:MAG: 30S ribosomal protein S4 [Bacteroides sp.]